MIFLKLTDGMGNQLFQYAFARYLQEQHKQKIYLDILKLGGKQVRSYALNYFQLNENVIIPCKFIQWLNRIYTKLIRLFLNRICGWSLHNQHGFNKFAAIGYYTSDEPIKYFNIPKQKHPLIFVRGFFQSGKYLEPIASILKQELQLKVLPLKESLLALKMQIKNCNSVCVHIRRGDYLKYNRFNICTEAYYKQSMKYISNNLKSPRFFIFSNTCKDLQWIKEHYTLKGDIVYVELGNNEIEDFYLMQQCKHFIISNSTYSWWTAWLSDNPNKIIVAPRPWIKDDSQQDDIYEVGMHIINV